MATAPAATPPPPAYGAATVGTEPAPPVDPPPGQAAPAAPRTGMVVVPRVGLLLGGSGEAKIEQSCSGTGCDDDLTSDLSSDFDDKSTFALELDLLFQLGPSLRFGGGVMIVPTSAFEEDSANSKSENGSELTPLVILEGVFGDKVAGTVRGFVGMPILVPADDLDDLVEELENNCDDARAGGASCSTGSGPFLGYMLGVGGGVLGQVSDSVALRGDLAVQYLSVWGPSFEASGGGTDYELTTTLSTTRFWLMAGLEF